MELDTNLDLQSGRKFRQQLKAALVAIQKEDVSDDQRNQQRYDELLKEIKQFKIYLNNLDQNKATHQEVDDLEKRLLLRIKHIYLGTDVDAIRDVILQMKEKGEI